MLVWGATGGIGGYAVQYVLNGGGTPIGVVSSPDKAALLNELGCRGGHRPQGRGLPVLVGRAHAGRVGVAAVRQEDPRARSARTPTSCSSTPAARRWARRSSPAKRGGTVVTCAATSGYMVEFDNRHFWMKLKRLIASHFANYAEAYAANRLDRPGPHPAAAVGRAPARPRSASPPARSTATSTRARSACCAWRPREGLGIDDPEKRARIGEDKITAVPPPRRLTVARSAPTSPTHCML